MCQDATRIPKSGFLKQLTTPTHAAPNLGGLQEISLSFPSSFAVVWYSRAQADRNKTPKYHKRITSALRGSSVGTKTGCHNYVLACMACQWATLVVRGHSQGPQQASKRCPNYFLLYCSTPRLSYLLVHYDNIDVYTCLCETAGFTLCNLANVQYAYELVGRDLNWVRNGIHQ